MKKKFLGIAFAVSLAVISGCARETENVEVPDVSITVMEREELEEVMTRDSEPSSVLIEVPLLVVDGIEPVSMYALSDVDVRVSPDIQSESLGRLKENEEVTVTGISNNGWYRIEYDNTEGYVEDSGLSSEIITGEASGFAEPLGNIDPKWLIYADNLLAEIPENVLQRFKAEGQHFYVTDEDINITEFNGTMGRTAGATRYGEYIKVEDRQYAMDEAVRHEFGHFVFNICGNWTRKDVVDAFNADVGNAPAMGITYGTDNVCEFYAEVFQKYIMDRKGTSQAFPNLAAIIENDLKSL